MSRDDKVAAKGFPTLKSLRAGEVKAAPSKQDWQSQFAAVQAWVGSTRK